MLAAQHERIGHARHGQMRKGLTPAIARHRHLHQPCIQRILQIALQHAVLDQHVALRGIALVIDIERTAPVRQRAVIQHRHPLGRHPLTNAPGKHRRLLAVEIALQPVAHRLVQQHPGPARPQHHAQHATRRRPRLQIHQRLPHRLVHIGEHPFVREIIQIETATTACMALLAPAVLLDDHLHRNPHQRPHIRRQHPVRTHHHHHVMLGGQTCHHLRHPRILAARIGLDPLQQPHLAGRLHRGNRIIHAVQQARCLPAPTPPRRCSPRITHPRAARTATACNRARCIRRRHQRLHIDLVRIRKGRTIPRDRTDPYPLLDRKAARLDDALVQAPALAAGVLEIQVRVIHLVFEDPPDGPVQVLHIQTMRLQQDTPRHRQRITRRVIPIHCRIRFHQSH